MGIQCECQRPIECMNLSGEEETGNINFYNSQILEKKNEEQISISKSQVIVPKPKSSLRIKAEEINKRPFKEINKASVLEDLYSGDTDYYQEDMLVTDKDLELKYKDLIKEKPNDEFSIYIYDNINKLRMNPRKLLQPIEDAKDKIIIDKKGRKVYRGKVKVALNEGIKVFEEAEQFLLKTKPMKPLIFDPKLVIPLPETVNDLLNKQYFKSKIKEAEAKGIKIKRHWKDKIKDPETSFLLMVIDDTGKNSGLRRRDILDPKLKHIGITSILIDNSFICYVTFSE